jgi:hypothetical protein
MMDEIARPTFASPPFEQEIRRIDDTLKLLSSQINAKKPWHRDVSSIVSLTALAISILTTIFTAIHGYFQQIEADKLQLHSVLTQINAVATQAEEMRLKYPNPYSLGRMFAAQNDNLTKQAYSLVVSLGNAASVTDINLVTLALQNVGQAPLA